MNSINFIHVLRAFAAFLIVNSHSDKLFPAGLSALGTGGSIGNAIFFFTSGYTLSLGIRKKGYDYLPWLKKRIVRLYPSFLVFTLFSLVVLKEDYRWYDWLFFNGSWFLQAIVVYYIVFFPLIKYLDKYLGIILIVNYIAFACFFLFTYDHASWTIDFMDNPTRAHWIYYFMIMLLGAIVSKNDSIFSRVGKLHLQEQKVGWLALMPVLLISVIVFYIPKYLFTKLHFDGSIQFIYPVLLVIMTYAFYLMSLRVSAYLNTSASTSFNQKIIFVSYLTLDIYIVHFSIVHAIGDSSIMFPMNYIFAIVLIVLSSYILKKSSDRSLDFFSKDKSETSN
ncbi:acyltransferase family protein [Dyadobacter sandarakinus]|uniref:Acyltransferase n=1 Tax=Dyadobacter sandarakinus TaxID=2747268 RepID=A0ABX7IC36_9BACT|nr:acyltransferase [Dyadobacter sandarakinus]QRR02496.1 acyltransferase [Dyadobacter sandarakinus]